MKFTITNVEVLSSQSGQGIKIGDKTIGCALITGIEGDFNQSEFIKELTVVQDEESHQYGVMVDEENIANGRNYVLVVKGIFSFSALIFSYLSLSLESYTFSNNI